MYIKYQSSLAHHKSWLNVWRPGVVLWTAGPLCSSVPPLTLLLCLSVSACSPCISNLGSCHSHQVTPVTSSHGLISPATRAVGSKDHKQVFGLFFLFFFYYNLLNVQSINLAPVLDGPESTVADCTRWSYYEPRAPSSQLGSKRLLVGEWWVHSSQLALRTKMATACPRPMLHPYSLNQSELQL